MKRLRIRVSNSKKIEWIVILMLVVAPITLLPLFINWKLPNVFPARMLLAITLVGLVIEIVCSIGMFLYSRFSPFRNLRLRKQLIRFTEMLTRQTDDGKMKYSIEWYFSSGTDKTVIKFLPGGLVSDKRVIAKQLSEFLREDLLEYVERNNYVQLIFGTTRSAFNGIEVLLDDKL